jgi:hypothetical protein
VFQGVGRNQCCVCRNPPRKIESIARPPSRHCFDESMRSIDAERMTAWSKGYDAAHRGSYPDLFNQKRALNLGQP